MKSGGVSSPVQGRNSLAQIIPGLPNDVALMILLRLPRALYGSLRRVCCAWRDALQPSAMSPLRNTLHISEMWAVVIFKNRSVALYDPLLRHLSSPFTLPCCSEPNCAVGVLGAVGSQVFVWHRRRHNLSLDIRCFDAASMLCEADSIPFGTNIVWMYGLSSVVVDGYLYLIGGGEDGKEVSRLDVESRTWEMMPTMHEGHFEATAVVLQGRLHVIGGHKRQHEHGEVCSELWDPRTGEWMILEPELWPRRFKHWRRPNIAVVMDTLYAEVNEEIFRYMIEYKLWISVGHLPREKCECTATLSQLIGVGRELWVVFVNSYKMFSCAPTIGPLPLSWRSIPTNSAPKSKYYGIPCTVHV